MRTGILLAAVLCTTVLAGCSGGGEDPTVTSTGERELAPGKGAIAGLLIDDIYRPIPGGLILLQGAGLTATSDERGQFTFLDVNPGSYVVIATANRHEAAPVNVDVREKIYTDLEVPMRRIFSAEGSMITTQYSVFIPCATTTPALTLTLGCLPDSSGDSYRPGLSNLNFSGESTLTYLVAEIKINMKDNFQFVLRHDDGSSLGGEDYGEAWINATDYGKVILKKGENYHNWQNNANWTNVPEKPLAAILFYMGTGSAELQGTACTVDNPACLGYFGAGQKFAIKANIVLTAFLGEPTVDVEEYHVLGPSE